MANAGTSEGTALRLARSEDSKFGRHHVRQSGIENDCRLPGTPANMARWNPSAIIYVRKQMADQQPNGKANLFATWCLVWRLGVWSQPAAPHGFGFVQVKLGLHQAAVRQDRDVLVQVLA